MYVINLFGQPGAGKSTGAAYIFSQLKLRGINAELVTEFAKDKNNVDKITLEDNIQFENAVITLRQSGLRFQSNREYPTITAFYGKE